MSGSTSIIRQIEELSPKARDELLKKFNMNYEELSYCWELWARPGQLPPEGDWRIWLLLAGRGYGKTRTGAEYVREMVKQGRARNVGLIAATPADSRDVMIEGDSGILSVSPPAERPMWIPSNRRLSWPNGAKGTVFSGFKPEQLRGPQHDLIWCDELAAWQYIRETWDMAMFGLRKGEARCVITTTPKPIPLLREILEKDGTVVTRGSTYDNRENLAESFFESIIGAYEGTNLGRQELYAEILEEALGALWNRELVETTRVAPLSRDQMQRVVVAVDPPGASGEEAAEAGIIVCGTKDGKGYVLDDLSGRMSPDQWGRAAIRAYLKWQADRILAEKNYGGEMVSSVINMTAESMGEEVALKMVSAGKKSKYVRAEPVAALWEQGKCSMAGVFSELEGQLCTWIPEETQSPDRLDAMVYAMTELMLGRRYKIPGAMNLAAGAKRSRWRL